MTILKEKLAKSPIYKKKIRAGLYELSVALTFEL